MQAVNVDLENSYFMNKDKWDKLYDEICNEEHQERLTQKELLEEGYILATDDD